MHARMPKNFVLEERLERYADAIEVNAPAYRGSWAEACWPLTQAANGATEQARAIGCSTSADPGAALTCPLANGMHHDRFSSVHLDLGCGKGSYIAAMAQAHPDTLFLGMDSEPVCVAYAAQLICELGLHNALVIPGDAARLERIFAPGELTAISINFPTPHPKRRHARLRVINAAHLAAYQPLMAPGAALTLRTDSQPLFSYALPQFRAAGWHVLWTSTDDRTDHPDTPVTEYEQRLAAQGANVHALCAVPGAQPVSPQQLACAEKLPQSLFDYLPDDLFAADYIPHGMSYAIDNIRNRRKHQAERNASKHRA